MQDDHKHSGKWAQINPPASQSYAALAVGNGDCADMLQAIRERLSGLPEPVANGHAANNTTNYQAWATRADLDECNTALGQLLAMVDPQQGDAERLVRGVSELRITLSRFRQRL